jgi:methyl-accepting chemotaxis protein
LRRFGTEAIQLNTQITLDGLRHLANKMTLGLLWLHIPIVLGVCLILGKPWAPLFVSALACAVVAMGFQRVNPETAATRIVSSVCLMISVSLIVAAFDGNKLQVDMHMYYFATVAVLVATCDWRAIAAAAATVAVHHLVLNFLMPGLIYPGGSDLLRVALHAVVLVAEASALIWIAFMLERFVSLAAQAERAEAIRLEAEATAKRQVDAAAAAVDAARAKSDAAQALAADVTRRVVASVAQGLEHLSHGDLTFRLTDAFAPDYEKLRADFNATMGQLQETMKMVVYRAEGLRAGGEQINEANDDLSRRTEQQASKLEETAAALDQITVTVKKTADGATETRAVVASAHSDAEQSGSVVRDAVGAMARIEEGSRQISQIISVIDEIAFQTNLLALNAGVEAARAGDSGKGFAVVASEVRALAQRSAEAAKEIKTLISASSQQVGQGVDLVKQTGTALTRIVQKIAQINDLVSKIAASAQEQATGLQHVNAAVSQMDQVTQKNAAVVGQTAIAANSLREETDALSDLVSQFRVGQSGSAAQTFTKRRAQAA